MKSKVKHLLPKCSRVKVLTSLCSKWWCHSDVTVWWHHPCIDQLTIILTVMFSLTPSRFFRILKVELWHKGRLRLSNRTRKWHHVPRSLSTVDQRHEVKRVNRQTETLRWCVRVCSPVGLRPSEHRDQRRFRTTVILQNLQTDWYNQPSLQTWDQTGIVTVGFFFCLGTVAKLLTAAIKPTLCLQQRYHGVVSLHLYSSRCT